MEGTGEFTARASLAMVGNYFIRQGVWSTMCQHVGIKQKVIEHHPHDKLLMCLINILAGGHGLSQLTSLVKEDPALYRAFGLRDCAECSTISDTLDACTADIPRQMGVAFRALLQHEGQSYRHDYSQALQQLDIDMTGWPGGARGEGVEKAFFADHVYRRGRQVGRVLATLYDEVIVDRLYRGKRQLESALPELVTEAELSLSLQGEQAEARKRRENTVLRVDAGGGTEADLNWMLTRDYRLMVKVRNAQRAQKLAQSVSAWTSDPKVPERSLGWVERPTPYAAPTRQLAIRHRKHNAKTQTEAFGYAVLVFNLSDAQLAALLHRPVPGSTHEPQALFNALHYYDLRGGGTETQFRGDKQGLGMGHRNKRRFQAQAVLVGLGPWAHALVIWARNRLAQVDARFTHYGPLRMVRDVFQVPGCLQFNAAGELIGVQLNPLSPFAPALLRAFPLPL